MTPVAAGEVLMTVPGIGQSIAEDLLAPGSRCIAVLKEQYPQVMCGRFFRNAGIDHRSEPSLDAYRCAACVATAKRHDPEKLKWRHWKD